MLQTRTLGIQRWLSVLLVLTLIIMGIVVIPTTGMPVTASGLPPLGWFWQSFQQLFAQPKAPLSQAAPIALPTLPAPPPSPTSDDMLHHASPSTPWTSFAAPCVNIVFGNCAWQELDLSVPGRGPGFALLRSYNSANTADGALGRGWMHAYAMSLTVESSSAITLRMPDGRLDRYIWSVLSGWVGPVGIYNALTQNGDGSYTLKQKDQTRFNFDSTGRLISIADRNNNTLTLAYNAGNLTTVTDASGRNFSFGYAAGRLASVVDPIGRQVQFDYNTNGDLQTATDPRGKITTYGYDASRRLISLTDANGHAQFTLTYDGQGRVAQSVDAEGFTTTFAYTFAIGQTSVTDPRNNTTKFGFDASYRFIGHEDALGNAALVTYDISNNVIVATDKHGYAMQFQFDGRGNITRITDALNGVSQVTYNATNDPLTIINPRNFTTALAYDPNGNLQTLTDARNGVTTLARDEFGQVITMTDAEGRASAVTYVNGVPSSITDALTKTTSLTLDILGRVTGITDPRAALTRVAYDNTDHPTVMTDTLGNVTRIGYDNLGNTRVMTDALGLTTVYTYSARNLPIAAKDATSAVTQVGFDGNGNRIQVIDPNGHSSLTEFDKLNRSVVITDSMGSVLRYEYDAAGNVIRITDPSGAQTTTTYDALNRPITMTDGLSRTTVLAYDAVGNKISMTDALGRITRYEYDELNRLNKVIDPQSHEVRYEYDKVGNRTAVINARGNRTEYVYDALHRLQQERDPLANTVTREYDENGNVIRSTDANGKQTQWQYDLRNSLSRVLYPAAGDTPANTVDFEYNALGYRMAMTDTTGVTRFTYDNVGRLQSQTNSHTETVAYVYDAVGNVQRIIYPGGNSFVSYGYNASNRLQSVVNSQGTTTYQYNIRGQRSVIAYPNGVITRYGYDAIGQLTDIRTVSPISGTIFFASYVLDKAGNRVQMASNDGITNYSYNALNQLTGVVYSDKFFQRFDYDAAGNRKTLTDTLGVTSYAYNVADQLTQMTTPSGAVTFAWDANGNMTSRSDGTTYTWDAANRPTKIVNANGTTEMGYDADGIRTSKTVNGVATTYLWNTVAGLPVILNESVGDSATKYEYGGDLLAQVGPDNTRAYYHADGLGSTRRLSTSSGAGADAYAYEAYGARRGGAGSTRNPFQFTGQQWDEETGLYFLRARYYDPQIGLFLSRDPKFVFTNTPYEYAYQNPALLVDTSGEFAMPAAAIVGCAYQGTRNGINGFKESLKEAISANADVFIGTAYVLNRTNGGILGGCAGGLVAGLHGNSIINGYYGGAAGEFVKGVVIGQVNWNNVQSEAVLGGITAGISGQIMPNFAVSTAQKQAIRDVSGQVIDQLFVERFLSRPLVNAIPKLFDSNSSQLPLCDSRAMSLLLKLGSAFCLNNENKVSRLRLNEDQIKQVQVDEVRRDHSGVLHQAPVAMINRSPNQPSASLNRGAYDWAVSNTGNPPPEICLDNATDPDNRPIESYQFEITGAPQYHLSTPQSGSCYAPPNLGYYTFQWRGRTKNNLQKWSAWSAPHHYTVNDPNVYINNFSLQPEDSAQMFVFINACTTGAGGLSVGLRVLVNRANDGSSSGEWQIIKEQGSPCFNTVDRPRWDTSTFGNGSHLIRVEAIKTNLPNHPVVDVQEQTYTLANRRPPAPHLLGPSNDDQRGVFISDSTVMFSWEPSDRTQYYKLRLSTNNAYVFSDPSPLLEVTLPPTQTSFTYTFNQFYPRVYWGVNSYNDLGNAGSNSNYWIGLDNQPPTATVSALPTTGYDTSFVVRWSGGDNNAGITSYDVQVRDGLTGPWLFWQSNTGVTAAIYPGTDGHTYAFRARAVDAAGNVGSFTSDSGDTTTHIDTSTDPQSAWWDYGYAQRRSIVVLNNNNQPLPGSYPYHLRFDQTTLPTAAELCSASQSPTPGDDFRIVYNNQLELHRYIKSFSCSEVDIWFASPSAIAANVADTTGFKLYYGNATPAAPLNDLRQVFSPGSDSTTRVLYDFEEDGGNTATDLSGNGNNGTLNSALSWARNVKYGSAINSPGYSGGAVVIPANGSLDVSTFTFEAFARRTAMGPGCNGTLASQGAVGSGQERWMFSMQDNQGKFELWNSTGGSGQFLTGAGVHLLPDTEWHHIALSVDGTIQGTSHFRFVRDGVVISEGNIDGTLRNGSTQFTVGDNWEGINRFCGQLDGVRFSNSVRAAFPYASLAGARVEPESSAGNQRNRPVGPPPTPTPAPVVPAFGTGAEGDLTVSNGQTAYSDNTRSALTTSAWGGQATLPVASASGFAPGDEVLAIQLRGQGAGNYEFARIASISGNTLVLESTLTWTYLVDATARSQVMRVPNYRNVIVENGGLLTAHGWDGSTGGVVAFRVSQNANIAGTIALNGGNGFTSSQDQRGAGLGGGFRGGNNSIDGSGAWAGEGTVGNYGAEQMSNQANGGGGAGGSNFGLGDGAGGGNGIAGQDGSHFNTKGGVVVGDPSLSTIFMGGGGGGARNDTSNAAGGGSGGGIIVIGARNLLLAGALQVNGGNGGAGNSNGGGGAGGSVLIRGDTVSVGDSRIFALGGVGTANAGDGGVGRIRVEYVTSFSGSTQPGASVQQNSGLGATATPTPMPPTPTQTPLPPTSLTWTNRAVLPTARLRLGSATGSDGRIYAIGGWNGTIASTTSVEAYDPTSNTWVTRTSMPTGRSIFGIANANDGRIYVIGGCCTPGHTNVVEAYDPATNTWITRAPMPTARGYLAVALGSNGKLYAIGGANGESLSNILATVEEYDPATNTWTTRAPLPSPRRFMAAVGTNNGKIYALGGYAGSAYLSEVLEYDIAANTWTARASMPTARQELGAVFAPNNKMYAIGGYNNSSLNVVEEYNPATNTWITRQSLLAPHQSAGVAVGANGRIYVIGGTADTGSTYSNAVEEGVLSDVTPPPPTQTSTPTQTPIPTSTSTPTSTPSPTPTGTPTPTSTPTVVPAGSLELLPTPWHLAANSGSVELYQAIPANALQGRDTLRIIYDLHGLSALCGDASAIVFDQNGWQFVSLCSYGQNGLDGLQTVDVPLADFVGLDPNSSVGLLHTRFWFGSPYVVDIYSITAYHSAIGTPVPPTPTDTPVPPTLTNTPVPPTLTYTPTPVPPTPTDTPVPLTPTDIPTSVTPTPVPPTPTSTPVSALGADVSQLGIAYRWSKNTTSTSNSNKVAAAGLNDGNLTTNVDLNAGVNESANRWEAAGIVFTVTQRVESVRFVNGSFDGNGIFAANLTLQYSTNGTTWLTATTWTVAPTYPYTTTAAGQAFTFSGPAIDNVKAVRVTGKVNVSGNSSKRSYVRELQAFGPPLPSASTNVAPLASAYRWSKNTTGPSNSNKVAAAGLNDGNLTIDVDLNAGANESTNRWEAAGVILSNTQTIGAISFINGSTSDGHGMFASGLVVQYTLDETTWVTSTWSISPAYPYTLSASGQTYALSGTPIANVKGVRVVGKVNITGNTSKHARIREVKAFTP